MEVVQLDGKFLKQYMMPEKKRHIAYKDMVDLADEIKVHSEGKFPKKLIGKIRPGESKEIHKYREEIFQSKTKGAFGKVITEFMKIRKSEDWSIKYDETKFLPTRPGESLYDYCEVDFPNFDSVTNWVFNILLNNYIIDPNACVLVMPKTWDIEANEYYEPIPIIFSSEQVYDYEKEKYAVLYSFEKSAYMSGTQKKNDGDVYYLVNRLVIQRWEQVKADGTMQMLWEQYHGLDELPVRRIGAAFHKTMDKTTIYHSRIYNGIPSLNENITEYSDLKAEAIMHIHSQMWGYEAQVCGKCRNGKILRQGKNGVQLKNEIWDPCPDCHGSGYKPYSPFETYTVKNPGVGEQPAPMPPGGYITKSTNMVEIMDKRCREHIKDFYSAINMEFLAEVPTVQSGVAKAQDRDALNTFVNSIAEDLVKFMDWLYDLMNDYRYQVIEPGEEKRDAQLPIINVPDKFDILSSYYIVDELAKVREAKTLPVVIAALELEFSNNKFSNDPATRIMMQSINQLDPFAGVGYDQKLTEFQNGAITKLDYILSTNMAQFVKRAINEVAGAELFSQMEYGDKLAMVTKYANEVMTANNAADKAKAQAAIAMAGAGGFAGGSA